ncbi:hypothetical protein CSUI_006527 [Cystoisospora suis]|uniref:Uncharacterized protein n=1 Tax=Cystoisospora suis TaxID=483139 RepID=A0A2C6KTQ5_9APIC|nr:hypothetical protein CSUI_006527 [Cystoisospora suis]
MKVDRRMHQQRDSQRERDRVTGCTAAAPARGEQQEQQQQPKYESLAPGSCWSAYRALFAFNGKRFQSRVLEQSAARTPQATRQCTATITQDEDFTASLVVVLSTAEERQ